MGDVVAKKLIKVVIDDYLEGDFFTGYLTDTVRIFKELQEQYKDYESLLIEEEPMWDGPSRFKLIGMRRETSEEHKKRLEKNRKAREAKKKKQEKEKLKRLKEYEKLKKEFG